MTELWQNLVRQIDNGCEFDVKVSPGARRSKIVGLLGPALKVDVNAPPQRGKANSELIDLLATGLNIPPADIQITRGKTSQRKRIRITNLPAEQLIEKLQHHFNVKRR